MGINKSPNTWPIPAGTRDLLPGEAKRRREMEARLVQVFEQREYQEVATPVLEYFDTLAVDLSEEIGESFIVCSTGMAGS